MSKKDEFSEADSLLLSKVSLLAPQIKRDTIIKNDTAKEKHFQEIQKEFKEKNKDVQEIIRKRLWEKIDQSQRDSFSSLQDYYNGLLNERRDLQENSSGKEVSEDDEVAIRYNPPSL